MKKENNSMARLGGILLVITLIAALLLGAANQITAPIIEANAIATQNAALQEIFADATEFPEIEVAAEGEAPNGDDAIVSQAFEAKDASGNLVGVAVKVTPNGFGGGIQMMVGIAADGSVVKATILSMSETPGLGTHAKEPAFIDQYNGKSGEQKVSKDGGEIEAITGATISSRAVTRGVNAAMTFATAHMG